MLRGKRFFLYCQHLAGTGHFVRTYEIALALAEQHDVYLVDGGRPVPRRVAPRRLKLLSVPRIYRVEQAVVPLEGNDSLENVMRQRSSELLAAIEQIRPDVVMVEHFPFSKWELHDEIVSVVERARRVNPETRIVCSLRDIVPATRYELSEDKLRSTVLKALHRYFDLVLVHADSALVRLEDHLPWAGEISTPIEYTGYVSQRPSGKRSISDDCFSSGWESARMTIISAGGDGRTGLVKHALAAWDRLTADGAVADRALAVFLPLFPRDDELALLDRYQQGANVRLLPFTPDFIDWMERAELSISQAGYNTCTNLLQTRTRAILVPNPQMADQVRRARLFAERGLAMTIETTELTAQRLASAIVHQLQKPVPEHEISLTGTQTTRRILERLVAREPLTAEFADA